MGKVAAVILAAGGSSRFGKPKQLLKFRRKSLIRRIVDEARRAKCSPIVVVVGAAPDEVRNELRTNGTVIVSNDDWKRGIGRSIRVGVQHLIDIATGIDAAVLLVCDQPLVDAQIIRGLMALREKSGKPIVAASYAGTVGVPALFDRSFFRDLLTLHGDSGAKKIILSNREHVASYPFPQGKIDIDTVRDWEKLSRK